LFKHQLVTIAELNSLSTDELARELERCAGSTTWVKSMLDLAPFIDLKDLLEKSEQAWQMGDDKDFLEAFTHHPKIGDVEEIRKKYATTASWAEGEQAAVRQTSEEVLDALAECNKLYQEKFGYIFIINATGKSAEEILGSLRWRLLNTPEDEIKIASEEQKGITRIRLQKLVS
jgi:2-oxo-4-hydroxy-4-carboxy-5-ureidoimidazoline decarboxylase